MQPDLSPELTQRCGDRQATFLHIVPFADVNGLVWWLSGSCFCSEKVKRWKTIMCKRADCYTAQSQEHFKQILCYIPVFPLVCQINHTHIFGKILSVMSPTYTASNLLILADTLAVSVRSSMSTISPYGDCWATHTHTNKISLSKPQYSCNKPAGATCCPDACARTHTHTHTHSI